MGSPGLAGSWGELTVLGPSAAGDWLSLSPSSSAGRGGRYQRGLSSAQHPPPSWQYTLLAWGFHEPQLGLLL